MNKTTVKAEPGKQELFIQREFEAPRALVFKTFTEAKLLIRTFEYEGLPEKGHVIMETLKLEPLANNRTKLTIQSVFQSVADRDGMVASGVENGTAEAHQLLDQLLAKLQPQLTH